MDRILADLRGKMFSLREAFVFVLEPPSVPGSPFDREGAVGSRDEPAPGEILFAMKPSPRVPTAAPSAPRRSGRWVAAVLALVVVGVGAWAATTQPLVAEQWASWFGQGRSAESTSAVASTAAATAPPDAREARPPSDVASSPDLSAAGAAASSAGLAASGAAPAPVTIAPQSAAPQVVAPPVSLSASAPVPAGVTGAATPKAEAALPSGATAAGVQSAPATVTPSTPSASPPEASAPEVKPEPKPEPKSERAVAKAAPTPPATPRAACAGKSNFSLEYCMQTQCKQARFSRHPQCRG